MHFVSALWQMSSVIVQVPVLISLFRSLEMRVGKAQLGEIILSEQVAFAKQWGEKTEKEGGGNPEKVLS